MRQVELAAPQSTFSSPCFVVKFLYNYGHWSLRIQFELSLLVKLGYIYLPPAVKDFLNLQFLSNFEQTNTKWRTLQFVWGAKETVKKNLRKN
jgi:hypothetical protein